MHQEQIEQMVSDLRLIGLSHEEIDYFINAAIEREQEELASLSHVARGPESASQSYWV